MCLSAPRSSLLGGCMSWRRRRRPNSAPRFWSTKRSISSTSTKSRTATSSASAFTPPTCCAATRSARKRGSGAPGWSLAAFTPRCSPKNRSSSATPTVWSRATATASGRRRCATAATAILKISTRAAAWTPTHSCRRDGTCCRRAATCGRRCRRSGAARSTARSVPCGAPTDRSRGSAASTPSCRSSSSSGGWGSSSSRSPTTTSIRSRCRIWRWRSAARTPRSSRRCSVCATSGSS